MPGWDGTNFDIIANRYQQMFIQGYLDVSGRTIIRNGDLSLNSGRLFVSGDASMNGNLFVRYDSSFNGNLVVGKDLTTNGNLFVKYDSSFNGNLVVGNDLTITGRLNVKNFTNQNIINTTTNNYQLIVSEDLSLNGRMYVSGNVGIGVTAPVYTLDVSSASTQPFRVGVGSTNALVVNSTGSVGIGKTDPAVSLDVVGGAAFTGSINNIRFTQPASNATLTLAAGSTFSTVGTNATTLTTTGTTNITLPTAGTLATLGGTETLSSKTLTSPLITGSVGIGITNPQYALDVSGSTRLGGTFSNNIVGIQFGTGPGSLKDGSVSFTNAFPTGSSVYVFCSMNGASSLSSSYIYSIHAKNISTTGFSFVKSVIGLSANNPATITTSNFGSSEGFFWLAIASN
jgi:hypothetical protein